MPTDEEYLAFRRAVIKRLKFLESLIDDAFKLINENDDKDSQLVDEAIERSQRAERAVRRLRKDFDEHEHE